MLLFQLFANNPLLIVPWAAAVLIALTIHELAHGITAYLLGDTTAKDAGRLTLNPLKHLDLTGSLLIILIGFGWAKPVPVNPHRIQKGNFGQFLVSVAGILINIIIAILCALGLKTLFALTEIESSNLLIFFLTFLVQINLMLFVFNLIPIAPLDGYRMLENLAPRFFYRYSPFIEKWGFYIIIILVFFPPYIISRLISVFTDLFMMIFGI